MLESVLHSPMPLLPTKHHIRYVVPSGNFGNALAGFYARSMGLPIAKLAVSTNENDILHRFFSEGDYSVGESPNISRCSGLHPCLSAVPAVSPVSRRCPPCRPFHAAARRVARFTPLCCVGEDDGDGGVDDEGRGARAKVRVRSHCDCVGKFC
jgi:hypothetical protein